jgi:hypothetical protein
MATHSTGQSATSCTSRTHRPSTGSGRSRFTASDVSFARRMQNRRVPAPTSPGPAFPTKQACGLRRRASPNARESKARRTRFPPESEHPSVGRGRACYGRASVAALIADLAFASPHNGEARRSGRRARGCRLPYRREWKPGGTSRRRGVLPLGMGREASGWRTLSTYADAVAWWVSRASGWRRASACPAA